MICDKLIRKTNSWPVKRREHFHRFSMSSPSGDRENEEENVESMTLIIVQAKFIFARCLFIHMSCLQQTSLFLDFSNSGK